MALVMLKYVCMYIYTRIYLHLFCMMCPLVGVFNKSCFNELLLSLGPVLQRNSDITILTNYTPKYFAFSINFILKLARYYLYEL